MIEKFPHIQDFKPFRVPQGLDVNSLLKYQLAVATLSCKCNLSVSYLSILNQAEQFLVMYSYNLEFFYYHQIAQSIELCFVVLLSIVLSEVSIFVEGLANSLNWFCNLDSLCN